MQVAWRLCFLKGKYLASMIPVITSDFLPFSSRAKYGNASRHHTSRRVGKCTFRCIVLRCCFLVQGWVLSAFFSQIICTAGMIGGFIFSCQNNVQLLFALKKTTLSLTLICGGLGAYKCVYKSCIQLCSFDQKP